MSGLEAAIRNALEKADRTNAEVRAKIYQSARQALEAGLRRQDVTDPAIVAAQRHRLEATIKTIENEERARLGIVTIDPAHDMPYDEMNADLDEFNGDERDAERASTGDDDFGSLRAERLRHEPASGDLNEASILAGAPSGRPGRRAGKQTNYSPSGMERKRRRRGAYARLFVSVIFLAFIGMGAWWVYTSDLLLTDAERDTSVPNPPAAVSEQDVAGDGESRAPSLDSANNFSKDWIEAFKPGDAERISAGSQATTKLISTGEGPAIQITPTGPTPDADVRVLIPDQVFAAAKGQQATMAISMKSASDDPVEVTVDCDFGGRATCERHRFSITSQRADVLIQIVPGAAAAGSGQAALVLNSGLDGKGRGLDLFAVRMLPVP